MDLNELWMVGKLALAALLGGVIGLERETHGQAAGLRTHMVVSIGSCLIMLVSIYMWSAFPQAGADPGRIAAQVVTGIGFLGAGAILRFGMSVRGLTTAACLWTSAAIGLAVGAGYWTAALAATLLTLVAIYVFDKIEKTFLSRGFLRRFVVTAKDAPGLIGRVEQTVAGMGIGVKGMEIHRDLGEGKLEVELVARCQRSTDLDAVTRGLSALPEVERVDIS